MKIQDALDLHLKEEASRIIGEFSPDFSRTPGQWLRANRPGYALRIGLPISMQPAPGSRRLCKYLDILPHPKEWGFLLDGDVFMPGMNTMARGPYATLWHGLRAAKSRENVDCGVHVAVMMGSARGARPFSDTQPCSTFRTATGNFSAA